MSGRGGQAAGAGRAAGGGGDRFPGLNVLDQAGHWDPVTARLVLARVAAPPVVRFFTPAEEAAATALCDRLLGQDGEPRIAVVPQVDARLAERETDGWRYAGMPEDGQAWRDSLRFLDEDSRAACGREFPLAPAEVQRAVIQAVQDLGGRQWHGLNAARVWSLWTRYACTAFYAHPWAWNEIGFPGPAYPRGYKNAGVGRREPFEVADARPAADPVAAGPAAARPVQGGGR